MSRVPRWIIATLFLVALALGGTGAWYLRAHVTALLLGGAAVAMAAIATVVRQRALRVGEAKFQVVFDRSTMGKSLTGADGRLIRVNQAFADMLGYTLQELQALNFANVTHPDDVAASREVIRSLIAGEGDIRRFEKRYLHRDGSIVWADVGTTLLRDRRGAPQYLITNIQNITERRRTEERLRALEARHDAILSEDPDIIMEVNAQKVYTWANRTGYEFFGDDVVGHEAAHYFEGAQDTYAQVAPLFEGDPSLVYVESWQRRQDGVRRLLAWRCHALADGQGRPAGALSTARDITEQHKFENEHRMDERRLQSLVEIAEFSASNIADLSHVALESAIQLTGSRFGFFGFYDGVTEILTTTAWSKDTLAACAVPNASMEFPVANAGLWAEGIRRKVPFIMNDYAAAAQGASRLPDGHAPLTRFLSVPLLRDGRVVAAAAVANKPDDYDASDARQVTLLLTSVLVLAERMRADERDQVQLDELRRWHDLTLGREDRIQDLKREVNDLCRRHAEAVRYPSQDPAPDRSAP